MSRVLWSVIFLFGPICCCCTFFSSNVNELVLLDEQVIAERQGDVIRVLPTFTPTPTATATVTDKPDDDDQISATITPTLTLFPTQNVTTVAVTPSPTPATGTPPTLPPPTPPLGPTFTATATPIPTLPLPALTVTPTPPPSTPTPPPLPADDDDDDDGDGEGDPVSSTATPSPTATATATATPSPTNTPLPPVVNFGAAAFNGEEWGSPATITVLLDKTWPVTLTVDYGLTPQTATADQDYVSTAGTLTFPPGQTNRTFSVTLIDDSLIETLTETVTLSLTNPGNPLQLGSLATVPLNIASDDTNTVNSSDDVDDGACTAAHCSLREAINTLNADPNQKAVLFDLPGPGPHTITPLTPLPVITDSITIDGLTQPGSSCATWPPTLLIELAGSGTGPAIDGLHITAGNSSVRGLVINGFGSGGTGAGLRLETGGGNRIECNFIGTDSSGQLAQGNATGLLIRDSAGNVIGGSALDKRNLISGNEGDGLVMEGTGATNNKIEGNYIGPAADGITTLGNGQGGISQRAGATGSAIGGGVPETRNLIAHNQGGGVKNDSGTLSLSYVTISQNRAADGAGVFNRGTLDISNSAISGNLAITTGGGIYNGGSLSLTASTLNGNGAGDGGGLYNLISGTVTLADSTLSANSAGGEGGGLWSAGTVTATNVTLAQNGAAATGGGSIRADAGNVTLQNSLIVNSAGGDDCSSGGGVLTSNDYNFDSDGTCLLLFGGGNPNDQTTGAIQLEPLADNGGPTLTHALQPGSPALDAGSCPGATVDQRGSSRPFDQPLILNADDGCDVGAFEAQ